MSSSCCRTCNNRNHAIHASKSIPSLVSLCLVVLTFREDISHRTSSYAAFNTLLNDIVDTADSSSHPSTFTLWSPCPSDPRSVVVVTTASETCSDASCSIYNDVSAFLACSPEIQHVYLDYSILSLATLSPEQRLSCDIMVLKAPTSAIAASIGKHFGWEPKRSSLSSQMQNTAPAAFSRPGDLVRDFWAWAELTSNGRISRSSSLGSNSTHLPVPLVSTNSDEKNMSLYFAQEDEEAGIEQADQEALVMIFQWNDRAAAERFKHPARKSFGPNGEAVRGDLWDEQVARPLRHFQSHGAKLETYKLELRAVEPRIQTMVDTMTKTTGRERSGSKRLSTMALGLGEKVSGIWR